jgi:hypothetical protein
MEAIIETVSGRMVDVLNPQPEDFDIKDIAISLGNLCRFNGQVKRFYSVAEHSVLMMDNVPAEYGIYALLHDAAEAYISDVVRPLKANMPWYKDLEGKLLDAIFASLDLPAFNPTAWAVIEKVDLAMLAMEKHHVMASTAHWPTLVGVKPMDDKPRFWSPENATRVFMASFEVLKA